MPDPKPPSRRYISRMDLSREFPTNTCGASRSLQLIAERLYDYGEDPAMIGDVPQEVAVQIAIVVEELWAARAMLRELGYESYMNGSYGKTRYRKVPEHRL